MPRSLAFLAIAAVLCLGFASHTMAAPADAPDAKATTTSKAPAAPASAKSPLFGPHGFDVTGVDSSVKACDDFYRFATGKWRDTHPLQPQYARFGRFEEVAERNRQTLKAILEEDSAKKDAAPGSTEQKIGDFYRACMNTDAIEMQGLKPIQPELDRVSAVHDLASLQAEVVKLQQGGYGPIFRIGGQQDFKNSKKTIAGLFQGGLGLPDRDYYLRDDERFEKTRKQYVEHVAKMLALAGEDPQHATEEAGHILALEKQLAEASMTRVDNRSPEKTYNITPVAQLAQSEPNFDWPRFLQTISVKEETVNVAQPTFFVAVNKLLTDVPVDDWKAYLRWHILNASASSLPRAFDEEEFNFNGRIISGQKEQLERWQRCVRSADSSIGQLLGQEYVKRNFTPAAKQKMNQLIDNLVGALRSDIPTLSWMGPETKKQALIKLNAFARRIGYPDKWRDYSALKIVPGSYLTNTRSARQFGFERSIERIGKPDDPNEWGFFTPATVNASYQPSRNDITFPAGILQPPFYDPNADDAYNYGGIGTVIGHEMTHGFDDQGAKFDADGNLRNWWTPEDLKSFQSHAQCIRDEYSEFNVAPGINTKGDLVSGEAIADLGGATIALAAYEKSLEGKEHETIDGFTPEQRFFLGFAQVWGENMAPQEQTRRALTDPHAQGPFRVNGTVKNMPAFFKAFGCNEGQPMVREVSKRCAIW
jgi:putative endopeptidase